MALMAYIPDDKILDRRNLDIDQIPEHKRYLWRPMVDEGEGPIKTEIIEPDRVRVVRSKRPPNNDDINRERS